MHDAGLPAGTADTPAETAAGRRHRPVRRLVLLGAGVLAVLVAVGVGWLVVTGLRARSDLDAARAQITTLRAQITAGDLPAAQATARAVRAHADAAHAATTGPVWALAAAVPRFGDPLRSARALTSSVALIADRALPPLVQASQSLSPARLRGPDGRFDLRAVEQVAPEVGRADRTVGVALRRMRRAPSATWLGTVDSARAGLIARVVPLRATLTAAARAARALPPLLGAHGPKTYMVSFQNGAELRPTGGLPGAFAIVRADAGRLSFVAFEPDTFLAGVDVSRSGPRFGRGFAVLYQGSEGRYGDSNQGPNFPYAARIWAAMWHQKTGRRIDGAISLDPTTLSYLLAVTGPVRLADGTPVDADNVVELTQQAAYERYATDQGQRKQYLLDVAEAVSRRLLAPSVDLAALVHAADRAADEHRLLMWTAIAPVERELADVPLGGVVPDTAAPYAALAVENFSRSKLDYYLHATLDYRRTGCGATRTVTATVTFTNDAPTGLPGYVVGASDPPGSEQLLVGLYGSRGGRFTSVRVDGRTPFHIAGTDRTHPVYLAFVSVPRGGSSTVVYRLSEPDAPGPLTVRDQPMINPMRTTVHTQSCP